MKVRPAITLNDQVLKCMNSGLRKEDVLVDLMD